LRTPDGVLAIRPEHIQILDPVTATPPGAIAINGTVQGTVFTGASELVQVMTTDGPQPGLTMLVRTAGESVPCGAVKLLITPERLVKVAES